jgi:Txe/YoeB family toxin of Txe-Axe toxin-antitoxin module
MLRFYRLPFYDGKFAWEISPINGSLLKSKHPYFKNSRLPHKVEKAIHSINYPYQIKWNCLSQKISLSTYEKKRINKFNRLFFKIGNSRFLLSIAYSFFFNKKIFETTRDAFSFISTLEDHKYGSDNCFQRSLLAAKISSSFKKKGVLFIGAEIASHDMHAWIVEDNEQPDFEDRVWINYKPLLAITYL